jgi:hypothetical protein
VQYKVTQQMRKFELVMGFNNWVDPLLTSKIYPSQAGPIFSVFLLPGWRLLDLDMHFNRKTARQCANQNGPDNQCVESRLDYSELPIADPRDGELDAPLAGHVSTIMGY